MSDEGFADDLDDLTTEEIIVRTKHLETEIHILKTENMRVRNELDELKVKTKEHKDRIKVNQNLPYLVSTVTEVIDIPLEEDDKDDPELVAVGSRKGAVIKTSTRLSYFLPRVGLVDPASLKPNMIVGANKDSYLIMEVLPEEYDNRVKCMEIDEKPKEDYTDIGGLDKQIEELLEAVVLPMTHKDKFITLGIKPPKGALLYGPPGTGKTLLARACAAKTNVTYLKLAASQLVHMFIGDGAKMIRDVFALAKAKAPTIIFIDELDAIGMKRFNSEKSGDREVQRTMLELLNQLDGFSLTEDIRVIAATNRVDTLDPALLRSGRFDNKIEFPNPNEDARCKILKIHSRKLKLDENVGFNELASSTELFNGAMLRGVCIEAGMIAMRRRSKIITHEDFLEGIIEIQCKKKANLLYYA